MKKIKRILAPIDFSEPSLQAVRYAADLAHAFHARLEILHVIEIMAYAPLIGPSIDMERVRQESERAARERLDKLAADLKKHWLRCNTVITIGVPDLSIVDRAKKTAVDLIVMGTHGRRGVRRFFVGSVAERVVRSSACPVLTVPGRAP